MNKVWAIEYGILLIISDGRADFFLFYFVKANMTKSHRLKKIYDGNMA